MKLFRTFVFSFFLLYSGGCIPGDHSVTPNIKEGSHYKLIDPAQPMRTNAKIEVVEMFWYGCPHCYRLEPYLQRWLKTKPTNVKFIRIPGVVNNQWALHAKLFYTMKFLRLENQLHQKIFDEIHQNNHPLKTEADIEQFLLKQGVNKADFRHAFDSFAGQYVNIAKSIGQSYGIDGVPAIIINGKYMTSSYMEGVGNNAKLLRVIDAIIAFEQKKLASK